MRLDDKPQLRHVVPISLLVEGRQVIGLQDPLQLTDKIVCVSEDSIRLLSLLDGTRTIKDIQWELTRIEGRLVLSDEIVELVNFLEEACLLEGDRAREAYGRKVKDYRDSPYRPAAHAGMSYSADPAELSTDLDSYFLEDDGPGAPDYFSDNRRPKGVIAPHIDIKAGGGLFAKAYHALAQGQPSDLYVILGTGHEGVEGLFAATNLDFNTPLGTVSTDREFLAKLSERMGEDMAAEELLHAREHVIEFQVVFLQHVFSGRRDFKIAPILCGLSPYFFSGAPVFEPQRERFFKFCQALKDTCRDGGKSVCFIASADLDHIGPRYDDDFIPDQGTVQNSLDKDMELLSCLEKLDVDGFVHGVLQDEDRRRICGFSPITAMLHAMDASEGRLLGLDYSHVDNRNSFVSYASMIFH